MIVHRLLDAVFRTLDAVDAARERLERAWPRRPPTPASQWPPIPEGAPGEAPQAADVTSQTPPPKTSQKTSQKTEGVAEAARPPSTQKAPPSKKADSVRPKPASKNPEKKGTRKGSVDRSGKDFDSPRARAIHAALLEGNGPVATKDSALDGKKVLGRVLWALAAAEDTGAKQGLTAADASALLSLAAGLEVFATNVARAFRDEDVLFEETVPDGRSKRYKLTDAGRARLKEVQTRPISGA